MNNSILLPMIIILSLVFQLTGINPAIVNDTKKQVISCSPGDYYTLKDLPRIKHPRLIYPDEKSNYPKVEANDNRVPAGKLENNVLYLNLELVWSDFYPETDNRPGLRLVTIAEKGKAPTIPAPLIRVQTGTRIHVKLHNTLTDSTVTIYGLQKRLSTIQDSVILKPGETKETSFDAGNEGTYMYWVKLGSFNPDIEEQQLAGAFIIDPKGGSKPDRVMVINIFGTPIDTALFKNGYLESLTINGRSWPNTERITPSVGDTLRWRVINASIRDHPMHLHGFNFTTLSIGSVLADRVYNPGYEPRVVTQYMMPRSTMNMEWVASRPGNWLFHCHLSFHVSKDIRLPGAEQLDSPGKVQHMAGLVMGIYVKPGPSDLISKGHSHELSLYANNYKSSKWPRNGFSFSSHFNPDTNTISAPGPMLLLKQYQPTFVTVTNQMSVPTSVHWHGLDLDSWADGVPDWSASDGKMSPSIQPGGKFTYKLTLMRPGTYMYHSHFDDVNQVASGLYGPIIVMGENEIYNPKTDHNYIVGWKSPNPRSIQDLVLNGSFEQPIQNATVGETHRLRLIHIAPAGAVKIKMLKDSTEVSIKFIAKDGTDLSPKQQTFLKESQYFGVGETGDFEFKPEKPGTYSLQFIIVEGLFFWTQKWIVTDK